MQWKLSFRMNMAIFSAPKAPRFFLAPPPIGEGIAPINFEILGIAPIKDLNSPPLPPPPQYPCYIS